MGRSSNLIPPRDWRRYWWAYLLHGLSGGLAAVGILMGGVWRTFALVGLAVEMFYQLVEFLRRGDTPARDVKDVKLGYYFTIGAIILICWLTGRKQQEAGGND